MTAESTMSDHAESVIAAALSEQGAAYPRCGASLIMDALRLIAVLDGREWKYRADDLQRYADSLQVSA